MDALDEAAGWTRAYLEWMDECMTGVALSGGRDLRRRDVFREAMLLMISRTEHDCEQVAEALERAERMLKDEREGWRAVSALGGCDRRRNDAGPAVSSQGREETLDELVAELHALEAKVLALRPGVRR